MKGSLVLVVPLSPNPLAQNLFSPRSIEFNFCLYPLNQRECVPADRSDDEEDEPEEEEKEEDNLYRGGATAASLSSAYKVASLSDRPNGGPWGDRGDPDQISTCPHCHLALPLCTLRWHEVSFLHHTRFACT